MAVYDSSKAALGGLMLANFRLHPLAIPSNYLGQLTK